MASPITRSRALGRSRRARRSRSSRSAAARGARPRSCDALSSINSGQQPAGEAVADDYQRPGRQRRLDDTRGPLVSPCGDAGEQRSEVDQQRTVSSWATPSSVVQFEDSATQPVSSARPARAIRPPVDRRQRECPAPQREQRHERPGGDRRHAARAVEEAAGEEREQPPGLRAVQTDARERDLLRYAGIKALRRGGG